VDQKERVCVGSDVR